MRQISNNSSKNGKAFEYACIKSLFDELSSIKEIELVEDSSMLIARNRFNELSIEQQTTMINSSKVGVKKIISLEPRIIENDGEKLTLSLQSDDAGINGDVRDILIIRHSIDWQIGISVKHNHFALKHSRLSQNLDFGEKWLGINCSDNYFDTIKPLFEELRELKSQNKMWRDIQNKDELYYLPLLNAFKDEIISKFNEHGDLITKRMISYLIGIHDFYKLIGIDNRRITKIIPFNMYGTLNLSSNSQGPSEIIDILELPTRIVEIDFKENSTNTLELIMNNGWQISFRIHNASSKVEPSLKFDVQLIGQPTALFIIDLPWE